MYLYLTVLLEPIKGFIHIKELQNLFLDVSMKKYLRTRTRLYLTVILEPIKGHTSLTFHAFQLWIYHSYAKPRARNASLLHFIFLICFFNVHASAAYVSVGVSDAFGASVFDKLFRKKWWILSVVVDL